MYTKGIIGLLLLGLTISPLYSQDFLTWGFQLSFAIEDTATYDSIEVLISEPFDFPYYISSNSSLHFVDSTASFQFSMGYGCISCNPSSYIPPQLYLKVYIPHPSDIPYFIVIPILSKEILIKVPDQLDPLTQIDLGPLLFTDYVRSLTQNHKRDLLEGIRVTSTNHIIPYKRGTYPFPRMERMRTIKCTSNY